MLEERRRKRGKGAEDSLETIIFSNLVSGGHSSLDRTYADVQKFDDVVPKRIELQGLKFVGIEQGRWKFLDAARQFFNRSIHKLLPDEPSTRLHELDHGGTACEIPGSHAAGLQRLFLEFDFITVGLLGLPVVSQHSRTGNKLQMFLGTASRIDTPTTRFMDLFVGI